MSTLIDGLQKGAANIINEKHQMILLLKDELAKRDARIAELKAALKDARDAALEEAALEIERIGHDSCPAKLITDGYASSVRSLKLLPARAAYRREKND